MRWLGVDGGGTKTAFTLYDENMSQLDRFELPTCHYAQVGFAGMRRVFNEGVQQAEASGLLGDEYGIGFGICGYGEGVESSAAIEDAALGAAGGHPFSLVNDVESAWAAGPGAGQTNARWEGKKMDILWNLLSLLAPLALGYFLKRKRFFGPRDYQLLAKIALNITLPAAVICSFADFTLDYSLLSLILLAFLANWATLLFTWATTVHDRENVRLRSMKMLCAAGYNLGNFLIPFVQQMLGGPGLALASLFDSGNSLMSVGGSFVFTSSVVKASGAKPLKVKDVLLALLRSVTIPIYLTLVVLALFGIRPPAALVTIAEPTGNANAFLSMFMIGLMFEIHFDRNYMGTALRRSLCADLLFPAAL